MNNEMSSLPQMILLIFFVPVAGYKIWLFMNKFHYLLNKPASVSDFRQSLEELWSQSSNWKNTNIAILFLFIGIFCFQAQAYGLVGNEFLSVTNSKEIKVSKQFAKKFCNSIAFGISKDSAMKFAIGETEKEIRKPNFLEEIDYQVLSSNMASRIVSNCGLSIGLYGEDGIEELTDEIKTKVTFNK